MTKYSNQQIVVPADQVEEVQKAFPGKTVVSCIGGTDKVSVTSTELTKEQAKELQLKVQDGGQTLTTDWNVFQTKDLALQIGKNAGMMGLQAAAITTGFSLAAQVIEGDEMCIRDRVIYFCVKFILSAIVGVFVTPVVIFKFLLYLTKQMVG